MLLGVGDNLGFSIQAHNLDQAEAKCNVLVGVYGAWQSVESDGGICREIDRTDDDTYSGAEQLNKARCSLGLNFNKDKDCNWYWPQNTEWAELDSDAQIVSADEAELEADMDEAGLEAEFEAAAVLLECGAPEVSA
eukprot:tig00000459_g1157.t1